MKVTSRLKISSEMESLLQHHRDYGDMWESCGTALLGASIKDSAIVRLHSSKPALRLCGSWIRYPRKDVSNPDGCVTLFIKCFVASIQGHSTAIWPSVLRTGHHRPHCPWDIAMHANCMYKVLVVAFKKWVIQFGLSSLFHRLAPGPCFKLAF